jgi:hypothetical protein
VTVRQQHEYFSIDIDENASVKNLVQSSITRVVGQTVQAYVHQYILLRAGLSCWIKHFIQVIQIRETVAMLMLNLCAKSCSSNPKRSQTSVRKTWL